MTAQLTLELEPPEPLAPPEPPPDAAARASIRDDTAVTMFVEAGAGTGKTTALVDRVLTLIARGVDIESIAAITFSEKAAAELRHRLRARLLDADQRAAVEALDRAPIGTLHAFARRLLFEFPVEAGLPPGFVVLDELESRLALDERWEDLLDELFDDAERDVAPGLSAADLMQLCQWNKLGGTAGLRRISEEFAANWDLVEARVALVVPIRPAAPHGAWIDRLRELAASPTPPEDRQTTVLAEVGAIAELLGRDRRLGTVLDGLERIKQTLGNPDKCGNKAKWRRLGESALEALRATQRGVVEDVDRQLRVWRQYQQAVVGAIVGRFVLDGARARSAAGTLEFHDLLVLARRLLASDPDVRRTLHDRFRCLLLDEFQDTDPIQLEIATRLTAPPDDQPGDNTALQPEPGRLFVVGDPKQSIYRFRRADIASYLAASAELAERRETLTANFRSTGAVIDWVNGVFAEVIQPADGIQPAYTRLDVCRRGRVDHGRVIVLGADVHDEDVRAKELRQREADSVAEAVVAALHEGWPVGDGNGGLRPCRAGDIAILLPARTSLPMLETALAEAGVAYRAENSAVVYLAPEIRDLFCVLRAAADPTDELSLIAGLRSPIYGCSDVELYEWKRAGGRWNPFADPPPNLDGHPVADAMSDLRAIARSVGHVTPAELIEGLVERRRVLETALAGPDARDVWRRVRYVIDQARAWTDAGGRGVRRYLRWAHYQAADGRAGDTILPEHDHDAVRIMTVHAAKGLEFPITIVSGLTTRVQARHTMSVVWPPGDWALAQKDHPVFDEFRPLDEQMSDAERRRLLYVACTRAVDHLVVSLHRQPERLDEGTSKATSATVLAEAGAAGHGADVATWGRRAAPAPPAVTHPLVLPWADRDRWDAERCRALAAASIRSVTSATQLAHELPIDAAVVDTPEVRPPATDDPALRKEGVDLDLPPWQRGRYGTAIGRAVHAVLQDVDLRHAEDLERLCAAQCAAEGIFGYEDRVAALCRSALAAPIVRTAAAGAEHWRELFVVTELGATVLEGYVDLLVRTPEGLVIVDYKTDRWVGPTAGVDRAARYRRQLAAYGVALGRLLTEPITGGVIVWCRPDGAAHEHPIDRWAEALGEVEGALLVGA